jgi:hypothetical protein
VVQLLHAIHRNRKNPTSETRQPLEETIKNVEASSFCATKNGVLGEFWYDYVEAKAYIREATELLRQGEATRSR